MAEMKLYINKDVAERCGCSVETVKKFAQKQDNKINSVGTGHRKTFIWFEDDIIRFKQQLKPSAGRPPKKMTDDVCFTPSAGNTKN
jgi:hypothetical protein